MLAMGRGFSAAGPLAGPRRPPHRGGGGFPSLPIFAFDFFSVSRDMYSATQRSTLGKQLLKFVPIQSAP